MRESTVMRSPRLCCGLCQTHNARQACLTWSELRGRPSERQRRWEFIQLHSRANATQLLGFYSVDSLGDVDKRGSALAKNTTGTRRRDLLCR